MIAVINKNSKRQNTHEFGFPLGCTTLQGLALIPLRYLEDNKTKYKNMGDIGDGLYGFPKTYWDIPDLKC